MIKRILLIIILLSSISLAVSYPKLNSFVLDKAGIIPLEEEEQLESILREIEKETTAEIVVLTVKSMEGESKEEYAAGVFEKNKFGKKDVDNGLLILISMEEREYRVEVGYGLEGLIPDASKVVIGTRILEPYFKKGEFGKGLIEASLAIQDILEGEEEVLSKYQSSYGVGNRAKVQIIVYLIFMGVMIISIVASRKKSRIGFFPILIGTGLGGGSGGFGSGGFGNFGGGSFSGGGFGGSF